MLPIFALEAFLTGSGFFMLKVLVSKENSEILDGSQDVVFME
jgi:hypothetical protein